MLKMVPRVTRSHGERFAEECVKLTGDGYVTPCDVFAEAGIFEWPEGGSDAAELQARYHELKREIIEKTFAAAGDALAEAFVHVANDVIERERETPVIGQLAKRVHLSWQAYRRRHPGRSAPIDDTLSRILEHTPEYVPPRRRKRDKPRRPLSNPGIFTIQRIAHDLGTTVGDLLGEPGAGAPSDLLLTPEQRRTLRDAVQILRDLFDLDDPAP